MHRCLLVIFKTNAVIGGVFLTFEFHEKLILLVSIYFYTFDKLYPHKEK